MSALKLKQKIELFLEKAQAVPLEELYLEQEVQSKILEKLKESTNLNSLLSRSYSQYLAQKSLQSFTKNFTFNFFSFFIFWPYLLLCLAKYLLNTGKAFTKPTNNGIFFEPTLEMLPKSLIESYDCSLKINKQLLNLSDIYFIFKIFVHYPLSFYFLTKIAYKVSYYRANLHLKNPKSFICCSEYSFTSSILTEWCNQNAVLHINIMHGEKLFHIVDSFSSFHQFYVWSPFYLDLFKKLYCSADKFIIELPATFNNLISLRKHTDHRTLTIFLQTKDPEAWQRIATHLKQNNSYFKVKIRPHPRWLSDGLVQNIFTGFEIENPRNVSIIESIGTTNFVCSAFSTVLFQGHLAGRKLIIDDLSNPLLYNRFKSLDLGALNLEHTLLSEIKKFEQ